MNWSQEDITMMEIALDLARAQVGRTGDNPAAVGCVIVKDGVIISQGATGDGGRPHAEEHAIMLAGRSLVGATAYVTLEPCAHQSLRGPTCSNALIECGITRVVACCRDPDPRTSGQGFARLKSAGVCVEIGLLASQGEAILRMFDLG